MSDSFYFGNDMQDLLLACMLTYRSEFHVLGSLVQPEFMWGASATRIMHGIQDYHTKEGLFPGFTALDAFLLEQFSRDKADIYKDCHDYLEDLKELDTTDWKWVKSVTIKFCRERSLIVAIKKAADLVKTDKIPDGGFTKMFDEAMAVGRDVTEVGISFLADADLIIARATDHTWGIKTGYDLLDKIWRNGWGPGWLITILAPPKSYKCEIPGTAILMADGAVKTVENIRVGDRLMGDDSTPRTVTSCGRGHGPLYRVQQANGNDYTVTRDHVLCVRRDERTAPAGKRFKTRYYSGTALEITAQEYAEKPKWFQRTWKGYKVGVQFPTRSVPLDPYFIGLWLGDGDTRSPIIYTGSRTVAAYVTKYAKSLGLDPKTKRQSAHCLKVSLTELRQNPVINGLSSLGILHETSASARFTPSQRVPEIYKVNDTQIRLELLAGLIDSGGHPKSNRGFVCTNTNQALAEDACWLARSLGFKAYTRKVKTTIKSHFYCDATYRTYIQGKISQIPTKVRRGTDSSKASNRTALTVTPAGAGDYYGFTLDANKRYLHSDFTVTHNSTFCVNLALNIAKKATNDGLCPVFYYACEISAELTALRGYSIVSNAELNTMYDSPSKFLKKVNNGLGDWFGTDNGMYGQILLKSYAAKTATIADIRAHALMASEALGMKPKVIIIDHAETIKASKTNDRMSDHRAQADIYTEARALGQELGCVMIMPDRCNKETVQQATPNMTSFQGSFEKAGVVDVAIGLCQTDTERSANEIRYFVFINRHGPQYGYFTGKVGKDHFTMTVDDSAVYEEAIKKTKRAQDHQKGYRGEKGRRQYNRPQGLEDTDR